MEFHVAVSSSRGSEPCCIRWREPSLMAYPEVEGLPRSDFPTPWCPRASAHLTESGHLGEWPARPEVGGPMEEKPVYRPESRFCSTSEYPTIRKLGECFADRSRPVATAFEQQGAEHVLTRLGQKNPRLVEWTSMVYRHQPDGRAQFTTANRRGRAETSSTVRTFCTAPWIVSGYALI